MSFVSFVYLNTLICISTFNDKCLCMLKAIYNINWRDVHGKIVVNNVDKSSLRGPWQNSHYKNLHTKHIEHQDATYI